MQRAISSSKTTETTHKICIGANILALTSLNLAGTVGRIVYKQKRSHWTVDGIGVEINSLTMKPRTCNIAL